MTTQHTPGPWTCHRSDWNDGAYYIEEVESQLLRNGELNPINDGINDANRRLIAAAPELLAALQKASDFLDYLDEWDDPNRVMRRYHDRKEEIAEALNSAIAKATQQP